MTLIILTKVKTFFLFLVLFSLVCNGFISVEAVPDIVIEPRVELLWTSQTFIIPVNPPYDSLPQPWNTCRRFSLFYCLDSFESEDEQSLPAFVPITPNGNDQNEFRNVLRANAREQCSDILLPIFQMHNFYSDFDVCCTRQCSTYLAMGYKNMNLTPQEYFDKLTDYSDWRGTKKLNTVWAYYDRLCDVNVIIKLGFGTGHLRRITHLLGLARQQFGVSYILKVGNKWSPKIPFENPGDFLTFDWFKVNIVCRDQPWICN